MKIVPLLGLNVIKFGDFKDKAIKLFGTPDLIENEYGKNGVSSEIWEYKKIGLDLLFDPDYNFRLQGLYVYSTVIKLQNFNPVGLSEQELLKHYPTLELEVSDGQFKDYVDDSKELFFFLRDSVVKRVDVSPNIDEYLAKYG